MKIALGARQVSGEFVQLVARESGEDLSKCYQCGNCSGGCPVSFAMEIGPSQLIRMIQLGQEETVLRCNSHWLCVSCLQCATRCPKCVNLARIMEALRRVSRRRGLGPAQCDDMSDDFLRTSPQQAIVAGFRKLVR